MFYAVVGLWEGGEKNELKKYFSLKFRCVKVELKLNVMKILSCFMF